ncbi:extensin family protein [Pseudoruegeria sp. SK021]|uniref:extensin-like domain-containing protein n=1 Tax=Pseudoruegeria sp. SK021 TaxID=1933035 RepID=UPI000A23AA6E|nr:extensin family protein [Pseudoruegeria sp. SK021]OSP56483.1 hypothetical protein BV911_00525 [Pseudoruegeria sp. SK021]
MGFRAALLTGLLVLSASALPAATDLSPRPTVRPFDGDTGARAIPQETGATLVSPRPALRPDNLKRKTAVRQAGFVPVPAPQVRSPGKGGTSGKGATGGLCGVSGLSGRPIAPIAAKTAGCGLSDGVLITAVDGIALSQPATLDCPTAQALLTWVRGGLKPAVGRTGGGVQEIQVAAHYSCRPRNNQAGAKVSEHGRGRAIDISGIALRNGVYMTVLTGWKDPAQGKVLRSMHSSACGVFGTVLGPGADRHHQDHLHFDTARYSGGAYCR